MTDPEEHMYSMKINLKSEFQPTREKVVQELQKEGFGVLTEIDVQATLKKKLDVDRRPYQILGACNPPFAHKVLEAEPDIGVLLPCNVVIMQEEDGSTTVSAMDPQAVLQMTSNEAVVEVAVEVRKRLVNVLDQVKSALS